MTEVIINIEKLSKQYSGKKALDSLELSIPRGSIYGLLGPNGSGKTTTLAMLLGITHPSSGEFHWQVEKKDIGALLETPNFYPYLNATENLKIINEIKNAPIANIDKVLEFVGLSSYKALKFSAYSLGMRQRLAIAGALLNDPQVLILDEPTNGLDPQGIAEVRNLIISLSKQGKTIVLASHMLDEVQKVCTHVAVLKNGDLRFEGAVAALLGNTRTLLLGHEDLEALVAACKTTVGVKQATIESKMVKVVLEESYTAAKINQSLAERGIYIDHLQTVQQNLEGQFLQILAS